MEEYMMRKRNCILAAIFFLCIFPVSASMVSFLVVETGISEDLPLNQISTIWESGLMAAFFDAGHIVTDSPVTRIEKKPQVDLSGTIASDFSEAAGYGAEYFVLGFIEYENQGGRAVPVGISLKLYKIDSKKLIVERNFPVGTAKSPAEEHKLAQDAGAAIISHLQGN